MEETTIENPTENKINERNFKELNLFTTSDYFENEFKFDHRVNGIEKRNTFLNLVQTQLKVIWVENCEIVKEDLDALVFEIGMQVNEENAYKARAIIGRWLAKTDFKDLYQMLMGIVKLSYVLPIDDFHSFVRDLHYGSEEEPYDMQLPVVLALCWCMIIESGVAAAKSEEDKQQHMPSTLAQCIFIEKTYFYAEIAAKINDMCLRNARCAVRTMFNFFIENIGRYKGMAPHQSECAYLTCTKRAFVKLGGDPLDFVYRSLDNSDWNLFSFIADKNV